MFYRRKIILALLHHLGGEIDKISLQKLLFLVTHRQEKPDYDFIPYMYGCFSYSANADLTTMVKKGILSENTSHFSLIDKTDYIKDLKSVDVMSIKYIKHHFGSLNAHDLMRHTYLTFPYWAINSKKAKDILSADELKKVKDTIPHRSDIVLYTIGYEGISVEEYLNRLIRNDVKVLVDVRANALSMKYGFSKSQLSRFCENVGVMYFHIPEVGIQSDQRRELNSQKDYDELFLTYRNENLLKTSQSQHQILSLLKQHKRIALTCFEADICQCHRKHLAEAIERLDGFEYTVKHI